VILVARRGSPPGTVSKLAAAAAPAATPAAPTPAAGRRMVVAFPGSPRLRSPRRGPARRIAGLYTGERQRQFVHGRVVPDDQQSSYPRRSGTVQIKDLRRCCSPHPPVQADLGKGIKLRRSQLPRLAGAPSRRAAGDAVQHAWPRRSRTRRHDRERRSAIVSCRASSSGVGLIPNASVAAVESSTNGFRNWYWVSRAARAIGLIRPPSHSTG
jgi:hypothetical protein